MQYAGWYLMAVLALAWAVGAVVMLEKRRRYYRDNPYMRNTMTHGLISFTDKQHKLLLVFWPITILAFVLFIAVCWSIRLYDSVVRWFKKEED